MLASGDRDDDDDNDAHVYACVRKGRWEGRLSLLGTSNKSPDNSIDSTLEPLQPF